MSDSTLMVVIADDQNWILRIIFLFPLYYSRIVHLAIQWTYNQVFDDDRSYIGYNVKRALDNFSLGGRSPNN